VPLIMYAVIARVPIEQMFLAGVLPALVMVACLLVIGGFLRRDAQVQPRADAPPHLGHVRCFHGTAQREDLAHWLPQSALIGQELVQRRPDGPDHPLPIEPEVHRHQPIKRGAVEG
jgi:hypothetical protein